MSSSGDILNTLSRKPNVEVEIIFLPILKDVDKLSCLNICNRAAGMLTELQSSRTHDVCFKDGIRFGEQGWVEKRKLFTDEVIINNAWILRTNVKTEIAVDNPRDYNYLQRRVKKRRSFHLPRENSVWRFDITSVTTYKKGYGTKSNELEAELMSFNDSANIYTEMKDLVEFITGKLLN